MNATEISVLISCYNQASFLEDALQSVFSQTSILESVQVIVVDDGSTDNVSSIAAKYETSVQWISKENGGQASAWNAAWPLVNGEFVFFLDADDRWHSEKLQTCMTLFKENKSLDAIYHYLDLIDSKGKKTGTYPNARLEKSKKEIYDQKKFSEGKLSYWAPSSGMGFRKTCLDQMMLIPEDYKICADGYLQILMPFKAREFQLIPRYLADQRIHSANSWTARVETPIVLTEQIKLQEGMVDLLRTQSEKSNKDSSGLIKKMRREIAEKEIDRLSLSGKKLASIKQAFYYEEEGTLGYKIFKKIARIFSLCIGRQCYLKLRHYYQNSPFISWTHIDFRS